MDVEPFALPYDDPILPPTLFFSLVSSSPSFLTELFDLNTEARISYYFDFSVIQDSFRFRALNRARAIAHYLIDDESRLDKERLALLLNHLRKEGYLFYPNAPNDSMIQEHMIRFLSQLEQDTNLQKALKRFQQPLCHKWAERIVLDSLKMYDTTVLKDAFIQRAVLSACLTPLRQSVGSCFASAPAILIQREQYETFLDDLYQLLKKGKLQRTFDGKEYSAPLCPNYGVGDLRKNLLLPDSKAMSWYCPGLIAACENIGIIPPPLSYSEKVQILKEHLFRLKEGRQRLTVEECIHQLLLDEMQIKQEDIKSAEQIAKLHYQTAHMQPLASKKIDQLSKFHQRKSQAQSVFIGMCDHALLKTWEFTLASFTDVKMQFSNWNLYQSLGFSEKESGGIGELVFKILEKKLNEANEKIDELHQQYSAAFDAVKATENLLRNADSQAQARRLQAEYQSRSYHMHSCLELRDAAHNSALRYSNFFTFLMNSYGKLFPHYFQELYDPQMVEALPQIHEDSLAGFRLAYKHGRADPSQWTLIYNAESYIQCLLEFFSHTEPHILAEIDREEGKREFSLITSALLSYIRTPEFLHSTMQRIKKTDPSQKKKTPWSYLSGGTIDTLLKTYFCREAEYTKEEKWVSNPSELLILILDTLKSLKPFIADPFHKAREKGMLMTSPSHAFILLAGQKKLYEGWQEEGFTYTWVRDHIFLPSQQFYANIQLSPTQQLFLFDQFCRELPPLLIHSLHQTWQLENREITIPAWRNAVLNALFICADAKQAFQKRVLTDGVDAFLFQILPIVPGSEWKFFVKRLLCDLCDEPCKELLYTLSEAPSAYMSAKKVKELAKIAYMYSRNSMICSFDLHQYVADHARLIGLAPPSSLVFADTNWPNTYFGFVVNPATLHLELWTLDCTASQGMPMSDWNHWVDGSERLPWSLYVNPFEYTAGRTSLHFR